MEEIKHIEVLLEQVTSISKIYNDEAEKTGENFNIFKILKLESAEVRTHSAFLIELLKPKGTHGQGTTFLELFIEEVKEKNERSYNSKFKLQNFNIHMGVSVSPEHIGRINEDHTEGGSIDILISSSNKQKIIIENKIYAGDQKAQLIRYSKFDKEAPLYYLTLKQNQEPSSNSKGELIEGQNYKRISYEKEIINWLENCQANPQNHSLVKETIVQYIHLIKFLTDQTINKEMEKQLVELFTSSIENLNAFYEIYKIKDKIQDALVTQFDKDLKEHVKDRFKCELTKDRTQHLGFYWAFENDFLKMNNLEMNLIFSSKNFEALFYGFKDKSDKDENKDNAKVKTWITNKFKYTETSYDKWFASRFVGIDYQNWYTDKAAIELRSGTMQKVIFEKLETMFKIAEDAEKEFFIKP